MQVLEFGGAFAQVFVFERAHVGGDLVEVFFDGGGGGFAFVADERLDVVFEFFVGEQFAVAFEDGGFVFALFFEDAVVEGFEVGIDFRLRVSEGAVFAFDFVFGDAAGVDVRGLRAEDPGLADCYAGGGGESFVVFHEVLL